MNIELLHSQVWKRFVRMPYGHILDYADKNGNTVIPTAEECQLGIPNVLGWCVSIENGAFFGGLYLFGLCEKYEINPEPKLENEINTIARGLILLCDVVKQDGCIARGVADDGISHYPFSSEDQFGPWVLGLWRLMHSKASGSEIRDKIKQCLIRAINGVRAAKWCIPTEWKGVTRGSYAHKDWRGASKLLFTAAVGNELGIIDDIELQGLLNECPDNGIYTRYEIVSNGFSPDMLNNTGLIQFWIFICAQLCVRELISLDPHHAEYYIRGLKANGAAVVDFLRDYEKYIQVAGNKLDYDWRQLISAALPYKTPDEAVSEAGRQCGLFFGEISPGMHNEKSLLGQAVFGCWIAAVSGDKKASDYAFNCLDDASEHVNWEECGYNLVFAAEAAIYCYQNNEITK